MVENGLFVKLCDVVIVGLADGTVKEKNYCIKLKTIGIDYQAWYYSLLRLGITNVF